MTSNRKHSRPPAVLFIPLVLLLALSPGCATIFNPTRQSVPVTSNPTGAEVWLDGKLVGIAPMTLKLDTRAKHAITVRQGDAIKTWTLQPQMSTLGRVGLVGDVLVFVPGMVFGAMLLSDIGDINLFGPSSGSGTYNPISVPGGIACIVVGLAPFVVDGLTMDVYELQPTEITADFE